MGQKKDKKREKKKMGGTKVGKAAARANREEQIGK